MTQDATETLEPFRKYLKVLAELHLDRKLRGKLDASDVVQQTMMRAYSAMAEMRDPQPGVVIPSQAAKLCNAAAQVLTAALGKGQDLRAKDDLADGIAAITDKMEPNEAALMLVTLLERSEYNRWKFALALSSVASRMQPAAAANACKPVAKMLAKELEKFEPLDKYLGGVGTITGDYRLASALAGVAVRLEPAEGKNLCTSVARHLG